MPSNFKKLVRARMAKTDESYQTAARHVRAEAVARGGPGTVRQGAPDAHRHTALGAHDSIDVIGTESRDAVKDAYASLTEEQKRILCDWILAHFSPAKAIYRGTSYGMKQPFTGAGRGPFYVTNNQFKGAMLSAGFQPVDPMDENWRFRVAVRINDPKPGSFLEWLLARKTRSSPLGDLARDAAGDRNFPPGELTENALLSYLRSRNACSEALTAASSAWRMFTARTRAAVTELENLAEVRESARQFHLDHVGSYDIAVDADTLVCSAVPKPWFTLRQCGGKRTDKTLPFELPAGSRTANGKRVRVFIVQDGICTGITSIASGRLTREEALRFAVAVAGCRVAPGCPPERKGEHVDWAWGQVYRNGVHVTFHGVIDADLAREREADVRAAVAAGKYPVLLSVGATRAARFAVIEKPVLLSGTLVPNL